MSTPCADRNLIFGLLALQMDFVTREQLLDAMHVWMLDKHTPLGDILCRRGVLADDERQVLDLALQKHLQRHGGDPQASLAALRVDASVRQDLDRLDDADVQASIASLGPSLPASPGPGTKQDASHDSVAIPETVAPTATAPTKARFRRLREHARGGLGEVFVALDEELQREVALKQIQDRFADQAGARGRFVREAEITGKLEHPGIVPVYGLGIYADGRPFYAMRFIRGESMHDAIRRFHAADEDPRRDAGERSLALRDLLGRFVAVCHAVSYAHARGAIHRDLKPANVMLGEYGETLVVDWGLARLLDRPEGEQTTPERPLSAGSGRGTAPTEMGQVVGTPAYMPPEQAEGRLDRVGIASDVFALGATLYTLLTGQAPYAGDDVLGQARRADVMPARRRKRSVPAALEAVCARAMAKRPEDRYPTARAMAEEVQRWLADEKVHAHREPLIEHLRRVVKRHRTLATALAVLLVTGTAALAVGLAFVNAARRDTQKALERSKAAENSASEQRQLALKTVRLVVGDIHDKLKDRPGHEKLRKALLARVLDGLKEVARAADTASQVDHATIWVYFELGDVFLYIEEGGTAEAKKQYERAHELARELVDGDPSSGAAQRDLSISYERLGNVQMRLEDSKAALAAYQRSLTIRERLAKADPSSTETQRDLSISYINLGRVQMQLGDSKAALAAYQRSLAGFERLAKAEPRGDQGQRDLSVSYNNLGDAQMQLGDSKAALAAYQQSLAIRDRLAKADPQSAQAQRDLSIVHERVGDVQMRLGDSKAALAAYQQSLEVSERLAKADPRSAQTQRDLSVRYDRLGNVQMQLGDSKAAFAAYQQSLELCERLAKADPQNVQAQRDLALSYQRLGDVQMQLGDSKAALAACQRSLAGFERLAKADPQNAQAQRGLSVSYSKLGDVQMQLLDSKAALAAYQQSLAVAERLAKADPQSAQTQRDLSVSYIKMGRVQMQLLDSKAALAAYQQSLAVHERLAKADPQSALAQRDLSVSYDNLGDVQMQLGDSNAALAAYQQSLAIRDRLAKADPQNALAQSDLSISYGKLGEVHMQLGDSKAALAAYKRSLAVAERLAKADPQSAEAQRDLLVSYYKLGNLEEQAGEFSKAADWYAKALDIPKGFPRPDFFKKEVGILEGQIRFCRGAAVALADPAAALKEPEALRLSILSAVAGALARQKKPDKALAAADLLAANTKEAGHLYDAACAYALCVPLAGVAEAKEKRAIRAIELLRQAVAKGYKNAAHVKRDTDLDALRGREDFKQLLAEMEAAAGAKKAKER